jgi:hypothetical protein
MPQRDAIKVLSPPWLREGVAEKIMYTFGLANDVLLDKMQQAMVAHQPGLNRDPSAIPYQAEDALLVQGPAETDEQFTERLKGKLDAWAIAGSRRSVLDQVHAYLANTQPGVVATSPECLIVGGNSTKTSWDSLTIGAPTNAQPVHRLVTPENWNWDGQYLPWRAWLILFFALVPTGIAGTHASVTTIGGSGVAGVTSGFATITGLSGLSSANIQQYLTLSSASSAFNDGTFQIVAVPSSTSCVVAGPSMTPADANNGSIVWSIGHYPFIGPAPVWGSPQFVFGSGYTWGVNVSPDVVISIRQILQRWKSAGTYYPNIIVSFGGGNGTSGHEFSPLGPSTPDGRWGGFGKNVGGVWVPSRDANAFDAFLDGTGLSINCYEKNVS